MTYQEIIKNEINENTDTTGISKMVLSSEVDHYEKTVKSSGTIVLNCVFIDKTNPILHDKNSESYTLAFAEDEEGFYVEEF